MAGSSIFSCLPAEASTAGRSAVEHLLQTFDSSSTLATSNFIDYQEMSCRCLGKKWSKLSSSQRKEFVASLKGLVEKRYYPRWRKIFGKGKITFQEEISQDGDILVRTKFLLGKKEELLSWRVADESGSYKVVSLSVDNKDLLERLKTRIMARQQKSGFDSLIAWMKGKNSDEPNAVSMLGALPIAAARTQSNAVVVNGTVFNSVSD